MSCNAWNPGLESEIPTRLLPLVTLLRPENAHIGYGEAKELADFSGLAVAELASIRAERLAMHEVLVQVTADLCVPDDPTYEVLGINLRAMVATVIDRYVMLEIEEIRRTLEEVRDEAAAFAARELAENFFSPRNTAALRREGESTLLNRLFGRARPAAPHPAQPTEREFEALQHWRTRQCAAVSSFETSCLAALVKVVGGILSHRGALVGDPALIARLTAIVVCNDYGGRKIGEHVARLIGKAAQREGFKILPPQARPVIMNVKGASAAGKSTIRPLQRQLANRLGIPWEDFALISPDYWRKFLLDYQSLGKDYKYAAMLTGQELAIIDRKLDRHMAKKAAAGQISHLLIDRFRFDSFILDPDRSADSRLLTRFGDLVFLFFMITPPAGTVERAWHRGLQTGRYKAVEDLLFHNVEAYEGMPELFFSWVLSAEKRVHYEFLNNDVPYGAAPRTAAFGWNNRMTILDVKTMIDIDRFRKVNLGARNPEEVFDPDALATERNLGFLRECVRRVADVQLADPASAHVYAQIADGELVWWDERHIEDGSLQSEALTALACFGYERGAQQRRRAHGPGPIDFEVERKHTVGRWRDAPNH
jgi:hypothetical protein